MRYLLSIIAVILLTLILWPWVTQFFTWMREEYNKATTFETVIKTKEKETKNNDDTNN